MLKITQGNDSYVKFNVELKIVGAAPTEVSTTIDMNDVENMTVSLVNSISRKTEVEEWAISETTTNLLYIKLESTLRCDTYGVEITGTYNGRAVRYFQEEVIRIVYTSDESDVNVGTFEGFDCYEFDDPLVLQFSGVIFPYIQPMLQNGHLYATNVPDGGNFRIENNHLIATDYEGY